METIPWQIRLDDALHQSENEKKKQEEMGEKSNHFMHICCCISISYLWSACLYRSELWLKAIKYTRNTQTWMYVMDERRTRDTEQDKYQLTLLIQPLCDTLIVCVSICGGMNDCVHVLTDACVPCWRGPCSSLSPPGQARPLCPASWDFWEASFLSDDISDETCCKNRINDSD